MSILCAAQCETKFLAVKLGAVDSANMLYSMLGLDLSMRLAANAMADRSDVYDTIVAYFIVNIAKTAIIWSAVASTNEAIVRETTVK